MILVTGSSGLLGATLVMSAVEQRRDVVGLYRRHAVHQPGIQFRSVDLTDEIQTRRAFDEFRPTAIVHCAAATNVDWCQQNPDAAYRANVLASIQIAQLAAELKAHLLFVSTDSVFDGSHGNYSETDAPAPLNFYAQTKVQAEQEVLRHCPSAAIARVTLYGWNFQSKHSLSEWVLGELKKGHNVPGFTDVIFCP